MIHEQWVVDDLGRSGVAPPDLDVLLQPYGVSGYGRVIRLDVAVHIKTGITASMEFALESLIVHLSYSDSSWRIVSLAPRNSYDVVAVSPRYVAKTGSFVGLAEKAESFDVALARTSIAIAEEVFNGMPPPDPEPPAPMTKLALIRENKRLRAVIDVADDWRQTLNLPQQDLGCEEFNMAWEAYDGARHDIGDLIPPRPTDED